jgi:hypothetical protein
MLSPLDEADSISVKIEQKFPVERKWTLDDAITLHIHGLTITFDADVHFCRIHRNWTLLSTLDMEDMWRDPSLCAEAISDMIEKILE